jgi:hypothetical protein
VTGHARDGVLVVAETVVVGIVLGAVMALVWWWVAPTEEWTVVDGGLLPADLGFNDWFAADGWFLVLGAVAGVLLTLISWYRGRRNPVALVAGVVAGAGLLAATAWTLGGVLGPPDPESVVKTADLGTRIDGSLGLRAVGVLCAPALTALTLLALLVASARVEDPLVVPRPSADEARVPQQSW